MVSRAFVSDVERCKYLVIKKNSRVEQIILYQATKY